MLGIEERPAESSPVRDGGADASPDADASSDVSADVPDVSHDAIEPVDALGDVEVEAATDAGCMTWPPAPPVADDPSEAGDINVVFAFHSLTYGDAEKSEWRSLGFDLDGVNTTAQNPDLKCSFTGSGLAPLMRDNGCGLDNVVGGVLWEVATAYTEEISAGEGEATADIQAGNVGLLLRIANYNGTPNDTTVVFSAYETNGAQDPDWDGNDEWSVRCDSLAGDAVSSLYVDSSAYVVDGVVVAHLDPFPMYVGLAETVPVSLPFNRSVLTATIVQGTNGLLELREGRLGGVVEPEELFRVMSVASDCQFVEDAFYVQNVVCPYRDVTVLDGTGTSCDAFSIGIGFDAWQAKLRDGCEEPEPPSVTCDDFDCSDFAVD